MGTNGDGHHGKPTRISSIKRAGHAQGTAHSPQVALWSTMDLPGHPRINLPRSRRSSTHPETKAQNAIRGEAIMQIGMRGTWRGTQPAHLQIAFQDQTYPLLEPYPDLLPGCPCSRSSEREVSKRPVQESHKSIHWVAGGLSIDFITIITIRVANVAHKLSTILWNSRQ